MASLLPESKASADATAPSLRRAPLVPQAHHLNKLVLVLVGLPARGKSYLSHKLTTYFRWSGIRSEIFNVGSWRRKQCEGNQGADFFASDNSDGKQTRENLAMCVLDQLIEWANADDDSCVALFDATNTTEDRRRNVVEKCRAAVGHPLSVIFLESICDKPEVLEDNYRQKVRNSPDYKDMDEDAALADLHQRVDKYVAVYEPLQDDTQSYIKLINLQSKITCNQVHGKLARDLVTLLMSIHIKPRKIWLTRTGPMRRVDLQKVSEKEGATCRCIVYVLGQCSAHNNMSQYVVWST
jgi:hypothetical protein